MPRFHRLLPSILLLAARAALAASGEGSLARAIDGVTGIRRGLEAPNFACTDDAEAARALRHEADFFPNSTRRDATPEEEASMVYVRPSGCGGFLVANTGGAILVATGRHCLNYSAEAACRDPGFKFSFRGKPLGKCRRVVAGGFGHDIALLELSPDPDADLAGMRPLRLAGYAPKPGTNLQMIGFPADPERKQKLTVSENCWILSRTLHADGPYVLNTAGDRIYRGQAGHSRVAYHNCSVYGGNSGGPVLQLDSDVVLGLPQSYFPVALGQQRSDDLISFTTLMYSFVAENRAVLAANGIAVAEESPPPSGPAHPEVQGFGLRGSGASAYCYRKTDPPGAPPLDPGYCTGGYHLRRRAGGPPYCYRVGDPAGSPPVDYGFCTGGYRKLRHPGEAERCVRVADPAASAPAMPAYYCN